MPTPTNPPSHEPTDTKVLGSIVSTLVAYAMSRGLTLQDIEQISGVKTDDLFIPEKRLPERKIPDLLRAIQARNPSYPMSIDLVRGAPLSGVSTLAYSARYGRTFRHSIELIIRNRKFISDGLALHLEETEDEAAIVSSHTLDAASKGLMGEAGMGFALRGVHEILMLDITPLRVEFLWPPNGPISVYEDHFGAPVLFGQERSAIVIDPACLNIELDHANDDLYTFADIYFQKMMATSNLENPPSELTGLVRAITENAALGEFSVAAAAEKAKMSVRSAQRIASLHDTTMRSLIQEARIVRSKEFLLDPNISIEEAAYLAGYGDDRAFRRAFRSWTGQAPSEFRRAAFRG